MENSNIKYLNLFLLGSTQIQKEQLSKKQLNRLKDEINKYEWTHALDTFLLDSVVRNYFNFDMVSIELNEEAKRLHLYFGATHTFTNEKCRIRWSYLHMKRLQEKEVKYKQLPFRMSEEAHKKEEEDIPSKTLKLHQYKQYQQQQQEETKNKTFTGRRGGDTQQQFKSGQVTSQRQQQVTTTTSSRNAAANIENEPYKMLSQKSYDNVTQMREPKTLADIEKELWKKNITFEARNRKDFLDVTNEDFSKNKSLSQDGKEITPSNFNIFRDSLRITSEKLLHTLQENLPDVNLKEIEQEEDESDNDQYQNNENTDEEEVLPLDFRTALIEDQNKVVIQAKPLQFKTDEEIIRQMEEQKDRVDTMESYLEAVKKEPFKEDDSNVILIDPDINIKEKFDQIDLACNREHRINNTFNAPMKTQEQIQRELMMQYQIRMQQKAPVNTKQYDTDTDGGDAEEEYMRNQRANKATASGTTGISGGKNEGGGGVDFNNVLKQWGVTDLNKLIGGGLTSGSDDQKAKKQRQLKQQQQQQQQTSNANLEEEKKQDVSKGGATTASGNGDRSAQQRVGLISQIMEENRRAQAARQDKNQQQTSIDMLMSSLEEITKPVAAQSKPQQQKQEQKQQSQQTQPHQVDISEEDSDVAPMSSLVDLPSEEELKEQEKKRIQQSVRMAAKATPSASEDDLSANEQSSKMMRKSQQQYNKSGGKQTDTDTEQIDTSTTKQSPTPPKKVINYKGMRVNSDSEQEEQKGGKSQQQQQQQPTQSKEQQLRLQAQQRAAANQRANMRAGSGNNNENNESSDSYDSAEDYFNQQRKAIRNKILNNKDASKEFDKEDIQQVKGRNDNDQEQNLSGNERNWDDDMQDFDSMMNQSMSDAQKIQEEENRKAQQEQERLRLEKLKKQEEMIQREQERKQRERDELMERLKKQDEERKRRKKEEKEKKEKERELMRQIEEERLLREQQERERLEEIAMKAKIEEEKKLKEKNESEKRKENFEKSIRKIWNGSDIPCLFDSKIAYSKMLYSLPVNLEEAIRGNFVSYEDLKFRRYKNLIIPIDGLLNMTSERSLIELITYFLRNSTMKTIDNDTSGQSRQTFNSKNSFPFKCIGLVKTVAYPPFIQCSLSPVQPSDQNAFRVLSLMFDTHDDPQVKTSFSDTLKSIKLNQVLSQESMKEIKKIYGTFFEDLAQKYFYANKLKDFPFKVLTKKSPLLEFENPQDLIFDDSINSQETLSRIAFFMEYAVQDDVVPMSTKESWDFIRRYPTFYAYNPNSKRYTKMDQRGKIVNKFNQFKYENVCVIFKEIQNNLVRDETSYDFLQQTQCRNSVEYFMKKAIIKGGLEVSGMRMIYLDQEQTSLYEQLFNEKLEGTGSDNHKNHGLLALFIRGVDAINKCENIIGHFNPQSGRATNEKSLRAFFGRDREHNCTLKMFASQKKNLSEQIFWFGGRVQQESHQVITSSDSQIVPISTMYLVVPPRIEKQYLLLSPLITSRDLPQIINILCNQYGISILDIQKINYPKFQYEGNTIQSLNRNLCFFKVRGNVYNIEIGFVLKLSRENLSSKLKVIIPRINKVLEHIPRTFGEIVFSSSSSKEYKLVKQKLKQSQFNVYLQHYQEDYSRTSSRVQTDYDTEDPDNYREINLFNFQPVQLKSGAKSSINPQLQSKYATQLSNNTASQQRANQQLSSHDSYETQTFLCFLKISLFRKQNMDEILSLITRQCGFEVLGSKIIDTKKEIYSELVPRDVRHVFKSIAFKFYEVYPELKLRKKISEFKTLVLVLRGRHVEANLSKVYDKEKLRFIQDVGLYESIPQVLFLTNQKVLEPLFDFILNTKIIKLYNDFTYSYEHFMDSPIYSYLLNHNVEKLDPSLVQEAEEKLVQSLEINEKQPSIERNIDVNAVMSVQNIVLIKGKEHLVESQSMGANSKLSACVCVIKPNQPLNVAMRTLKSIANNQDLGLSIQNIEIAKYNEQQLDLLFKHDVVYDETIPETMKEKIKQTYYQLFQNAKNPVIQFIVSGPYAITKMQEIIGQRDPKTAKKDSLRSFYGIDRIDNAYFISENFSESLIERDYLFNNENQNQSQLLFNTELQNLQKSIRALNPPQILSSSTNQLNNQALFSQSHHQELALVLISPTLVLNNDFVFVIDDLIRSKFNLCSVQRVKLEKEDIDLLFGDLAPRFYNLEILSTQEFQKGHSVLVVVEKEKAVNEIQEVVGRFDIKNKNDFEKTKKKQNQTAFTMFNYGNEAPQTLIQEYGSYIYTFPNVQMNQKKILRYFSTLPNSLHFVIENNSNIGVASHSCPLDHNNNAQ